MAEKAIQTFDRVNLFKSRPIHVQHNNRRNPRRSFTDQDSDQPSKPRSRQVSISEGGSERRSEKSKESSEKIKESSERSKESSEKSSEKSKEGRSKDQQDSSKKKQSDSSAKDATAVNDSGIAQTAEKAESSQKPSTATSTAGAPASTDIASGESESAPVTDISAAPAASSPSNPTNTPADEAAPVAMEVLDAKPATESATESKEPSDEKVGSGVPIDATRADGEQKGGAGAEISKSAPANSFSSKYERDEPLRPSRFLYVRNFDSSLKGEARIFL